ncbi:hypothetical protein ACKKBF_B03900 [Auxenochlorella protothecoides x Auxenochlorella symbiontica]
MGSFFYDDLAAARGHLPLPARTFEPDAGSQISEAVLYKVLAASRLAQVRVAAEEGLLPDQEGLLSLAYFQKGVRPIVDQEAAQEASQDAVMTEAGALPGVEEAQAPPTADEPDDPSPDSGVALAHAQDLERRAQHEEAQRTRDAEAEEARRAWQASIDEVSADLAQAEAGAAAAEAEAAAAAERLEALTAAKHQLVLDLKKALKEEEAAKRAAAEREEGEMSAAAGAGLATQPLSPRSTAPPRPSRWSFQPSVAPAFPLGLGPPSVREPEPWGRAPPPPTSRALGWPAVGPGWGTPARPESSRPAPTRPDSSRPEPGWAAHGPPPAGMAYPIGTPEGAPPPAHEPHAARFRPPSPPHRLPTFEEREAMRQAQRAQQAPARGERPEEGEGHRGRRGAGLRHAWSGGGPPAPPHPRW